MDTSTYSTDYSIMYDYNFLAGFIGVAPPPSEIKSLTLTTSDSKI